MELPGRGVILGGGKKKNLSTRTRGTSFEENARRSDIRGGRDEGGEGGRVNSRGVHTSFRRVFVMFPAFIAFV